MRVKESNCSHSGSEQHCLAAWQELGPAVAAFSSLKVSQRLRDASHVRHLLDRPNCYGCEGDRSLATPTCTAKVNGVAEIQCGSPAHRDLLQLCAREKTQPLPVGREEGVDSTFCSGDGPGFQAIHRPQINLLGAALAGDIREMSAIGREGHGKAIILICC